MSYNIAIDGPAGAGKSTVAKAVAKQLKVIYVDTGAMYRAMALFMVREGIDRLDVKGIEKKCREANITIGFEKDEQVVYLNGENVNSFLRSEEIGNMASTISALLAVRNILVELQRKIAKENDCVMDGRDIGTNVLPNAQLKLYLTASSEVRAQRRYDELVQKKISCDYNQIKADIEKRDYQDMNREHSPLKQAEDAIYLDTSNMTLEEEIEKIISLCKIED